MPTDMIWDAIELEVRDIHAVNTALRIRQLNFEIDASTDPPGNGGHLRPTLRRGYFAANIFLNRPPAVRIRLRQALTLLPPYRRLEMPA
jgi:hypothetical protein